MLIHGKLNLLSFVLLVTLMASLAFPMSARADDGAPPPTEVPAAETPPPGDGTDSASVPQTAPDPNATEASVADSVTAIAAADAVVTDVDGNPVTFASQQAADMLADGDPYVVRSGTTYSFTAADCDPLSAGAQSCSTPIQAAINFSLAGEVVYIAPGTYTEQLEINKNITVQGTASGVVLQSPGSLPLSFTTSSTNHPIIYVHNTDNASIVGLTVDGQGMGNANYRFDGIAYYNAGGTLQGNTIAHIRDNPLDGMQAGVGLYAYNQDGTSRTLNVLDNTIYDYQKNGMALSGSGLTANVQDNTVTGAGPTSQIAQNGIQISYGATGNVTGNTVSGNFWTGTYGGSNDPASDPNADSAAGILIYQPGSATIEVANNVVNDNQTGIASVGATDLNIHDNKITGAAHTGNGYPVGILIVDADQWSSGPPVGTTAMIQNNDITLNDYGILVLDTPGVVSPDVTAHNNSITSNSLYGVYGNVLVDATQNWWGDASGPLDAAPNSCGVPLDNPGGAGNAVNACVLYSPWLTQDPSVGGGGGGGSGQTVPPPGIPVTGGQQITIGCDNPSAVFELGEMEITFTGLCGYDVVLDSLTGEGLPGDLGRGANFLAGITITLLKGGSVLQTLPAGTSISLSYPKPGGSNPALMLWDAGSWREVTSSEAGGRILADLEKPGTFVFVSH